MSRPLVLITSLCLAACSGGGRDESRAESRAAGAAPVFVSVDWLAARLATGDVTLLDARPSDAYEHGHLPGARSLPFTATYDKRPGNEKNVASVQTINRVLGDAGIRIDRQVVIYGDRDYRAPARLFWVLETHGHGAVAVLDGGVEAWVAAGHALSQEVPAWAGTQYVSSFDPERLVDKLEMFRALEDPNIAVVDSRSRAEYVGDKSKGKRFGHITTARHFDAEDATHTEEGVCSVEDRSALEHRYESLNREQTIYTYCNTGRRASVNYLILRSLDYRVAVYDGSWMEWSHDENLPISSGVEPGQLNR